MYINTGRTNFFFGAFQLEIDQSRDELRYVRPSTKFALMLENPNKQIYITRDVGFELQECTLTLRAETAFLVLFSST